MSKTHRELSLSTAFSYSLLIGPRWREVFSDKSNAEPIPPDVAKFIVNLVLTGLSDIEVLTAIEEVERLHDLWKRAGSPFFVEARQAHDFLAYAAHQDEACTTEPGAVEQAVDMRTFARHKWAELSCRAPSAWGFSRAFANHDPRLIEAWPKPGTSDYRELIQTSAERLVRGLVDGEIPIGLMADVAAADFSVVRRLDNDADLDREFDLACAKADRLFQPEANMMGVPVQALRYALARPFWGMKSLRAIKYFADLWRDEKCPSFVSPEELTSFLAYGLRKRWVSTRPQPGEPIPHETALFFSTITQFAASLSRHEGITAFGQELAKYEWSEEFVYGFEAIDFWNQLVLVERLYLARRRPRDLEPCL